MTHAFDTEGTTYDKFGDPGTLWTSAADEQQFKERDHFLPFMRQILRVIKIVSQKSGTCRIDFKRKTKYFLE